MTKKEFISALDGYPEDSQIIFNIDGSFHVFELDYINCIDDDFMPDLCSDKPFPKLIIHLNDKDSRAHNEIV